MLALATANAVGVVLFGVLYAAGGAGMLPQAAFLACLGILFSLVTVLWTWTEHRHRRLDPLARVGRVAVGLASVVIATPMVVLMPLFWLDTQLPDEAGLRRVLGPVMAIVLVSLVLVALTNVIGSIAAAVIDLRRRG